MKNKVLTYLLICCTARDEVSLKLHEYIIHVNNKFGRMPNILCMDSVTEYTGQAIQDILIKDGIAFLTTVPFALEQNGVAE